MGRLGRAEMQFILSYAKKKGYTTGKEIASAIGLTYTGYAYKLKDPNRLQGKDIYRLHKRCGVPYDKIMELLDDYNEGRGIIFEKK